MLYWLKHWAGTLLLPVYALRRGRWALAAATAGGATVHFGAMALLYRSAPLFTGYALIAPSVLLSGALMFGNWSQHIFVAPEVATMPQVKKSYPFNAALTYNCMNTPDNQLTFNDGYHITHHINSRCHWLELPKQFLMHLEDYAAADAIIFDGLCFFEVGLHVMLGNYRKLYEHFVHLTPEKRPFEQVEAELRRRLQPVRRDRKAQ